MHTQVHVQKKGDVKMAVYLPGREAGAASEGTNPAQTCVSELCGFHSPGVLLLGGGADPTPLTRQPLPPHSRRQEGQSAKVNSKREALGGTAKAGWGGGWWRGGASSVPGLGPRGALGKGPACVRM